MKLSLDALLVLDAIDRKGSFARAAEELHRVPSALTYTVQKLEQDLDVAIFNREGHKAVLTDIGKELLAQGRHLLLDARRLEERIEKMSKGWETTLRIAVETIVDPVSLFQLIEDFYQQEGNTRIRIYQEVLSGSWDALLSGRVDLIIAAEGEAPADADCSSFSMGKLEMVFVVAPKHALAAIERPLTEDDIQQHLVIAVGDSARELAPRSRDLISGQETLTVQGMREKIIAQVLGLGVGYVPKHMIKSELETGTLIEKEVEGDRHLANVSVAWRSGEIGKSLQWWLAQLKKEDTIAALIN